MVVIGNGGATVNNANLALARYYLTFQMALAGGAKHTS